jgi:hypothetical protein
VRRAQGGHLHREEFGVLAYLTGTHFCTDLPNLQRSMCRRRAVQCLAVTVLSSEAFQLAWTGGCATGLRTRSRHGYVFLSASSPFSAGSAAAFDSALARCHGSRLLPLRLPFVSLQRCRFYIADFRKLSRVLPRPRVLPGTHAQFVQPFGRFGLADLVRDLQSLAPVLIHSSNRLPLVTAIGPGSKLTRTTLLDSRRFLIVPHRAVPFSRS